GSHDQAKESQRVRAAGQNEARLRTRGWRRQAPLQSGGQGFRRRAAPAIAAPAAGQVRRSGGGGGRGRPGGLSLFGTPQALVGQRIRRELRLSPACGSSRRSEERRVGKGSRLRWRPGT